ncbi:hypothetical protein TNCV_799871 [Trichonephila clavipes]|nr:hypothetical protein TNCV_799871 [Trichonephila clavipes]
MALAAAETMPMGLKISYIFLNGVVTAVSLDTGKVVDAKILSQKCLQRLHNNECSASYIENSRGMEIEEESRIVSFTMNQKEARIKNKQLKCKQEDDLADDTSKVIVLRTHCKCSNLSTYLAVDRPVVRASDSKPEDLGSIPDPTKYPLSTHGVRARSISWFESFVDSRSRNHGCSVLENISLPSSPCLNCRGGVAIYCVEDQPVTGSGNFPTFPSQGTPQQQHIRI